MAEAKKVIRNKVKNVESLIDFHILKDFQGNLKTLSDENKTKLKRSIITKGFITALIVANVIASKILMFWGFIVPAGFITYAITFLFTDIISEYYGKDEARRTVWLGFGCTILASTLIFIGLKIPVAPFASQTGEAYKVLLGWNWRIALASMVAYLIAQNLDVTIFHWLGGLTKGKHKWIRNNGSTMVSQFADSVIFILIAFAGSNPHIMAMIISQWVLKLIIAAVDTPVFYLITRGQTLKDFRK